MEKRDYILKEIGKISLPVRFLIGMQTRILIHLYFISAIFILFSCNQTELPDRIIWFDRPADYFEEAFPLGNGRIGATLFGGTGTERIILNEATFWAGGPVDPWMNKDAYKHLPAVRKALFDEDYPLADRLARNLQGKFSESYAPLGDLFLDFIHQDSITGYSRELNLRTGIAKVEYDSDGSHFTREVFVSFPDQLTVISLSGSGRSKLNFALRYNSRLKYSVHASENILYMKGRAPVHAEPNYRGDIPDAILYDEHKGMRFEVKTMIGIENGQIVQTDTSLYVRNADRAILLVSVATSFNGYNKEPGLEGIDENKIASNYLSRVSEINWRELKRRHIDDFSQLFSRVTLDLGINPVPDSPIDERLKRYSEGKTDNDLEALYFQFGRYLVISGSRSGRVPTNLQGIWNPHIRHPWSSNYTTNINAEMNYWPAEVCNLSECHKPLLDFIQNLSATGEITAKTFYDCRGWCCSHNTDIWAMTNPVGNFGEGHPVWANWSMAGPWYCAHLWEHFLFTRDTVFLQEYAYPLMSGAAIFCLDYLTEGPDGYLVTAPSTSPENLYLTPEGYRGATLYGSTADMAMIREHLSNTLEAAELLGRDPGFVAEMKEVLEKLYPYRIGVKGNLQEWYHDWEDADPHHRHQSHLFGLHPGTTISPFKTPELAKACERSLELRGDGGTGWSKAWKINLWARLLDGNHAYTMLRTHLNYVSPSPETTYRGGGTYPNLWDAHPPFQIDGNFGGTAGIAEMLLQSHDGEIHLLPALPDAWPSGSVKGLRARGGYTVNITWQDGKLVKSEVTSDFDNKVNVRWQKQTSTYHIKKGESVSIVE